KYIYLPFGDSKRSDLLFEEEDGRFFRVQCKTGRLRNGAVSFYPCSVDSRSQPGKCLPKRYNGEVDFFGVCCPDNKKTYLVPIEDAGGYQRLLRVEPPRSKQQKNIRWAKVYEIGSAPEIDNVLGLSCGNSPAIILVE